MPRFVNQYTCVHCKAKFWWWLLPFRASGKHEKDCPVLSGRKKPKFKELKVLKRNFVK